MSSTLSILACVELDEMPYETLSYCIDHIVILHRQQWAVYYQEFKLLVLLHAG